MARGVCDGLQVVEMGGGSIASSIVGMVLADAGARVVKIEPPEGDALRRENPSGFKVWNRGKESRVVDLRTREGQGALRDLARGADVVIEAFAPGVAEGWGLGAEALRALNPGLVHCSITGFGKTGPYAHIKGYDAVVAAKMGLWTRGDFGFREGPQMFPPSWASFGAAMQAVAGVMGALTMRERTSRGQAVETTLAGGLEPLDYMVTVAAQLGAKRGAAPGDRSAMPVSRYGVLAVTRDGRLLQTATVLPHQAHALCRVAGLAELIDDPRFQKLPAFDNVDDAQVWEDALLEAFLQYDLDYWTPKLLADPDIAFEVAGTSEQGLDHPQMRHNGDVVVLGDPECGPVEQVGPIAHFSHTPIGPTKAAPRLGEGRSEGFSPTPLVADGPAPQHPFSGVTIVEFGYFYAMPYAVTMLAELGARVIKIEDLKGDPHRVTFGPEVASTKTTAGKESVSIDLSRPEGQEAARRIVAKADVFVTGFRSGIPEKFGLGQADLQKLNPRLLYVHAAGYGGDGPYAHRALYAQAAQAVGGSFGRQVGYWSDPARIGGWSLMELQALVFPRLHQVIDGDSNPALAVMAAIALGVYEQSRSGEGQRLDTSMIAGNAWAYADDFCRYAGKPPVKLCDEAYFGTGALARLYECAAQTWVCVEARGEAEFQALARVVQPDLASDPRFAASAARQAHDDELIAALSQAVLSRSALEWEALLSAVGVGAAAVGPQGHPASIAFDPNLRAAGLTVAYDHPLFGEMVRWAPHVRFSDAEGRIAPPSQRGQHNRQVLAEAGYSDADLDRLEKDGVVRGPGA